MNPQQPQDGQSGQLPPPNQNPYPSPQPQPAPQQPLTPPTPVVTIPGQGQQVVTPIQPVDPSQQPAVERSPYDFIFNPQQPAKKTPVLATGSKTTRIAIFGGGLVALVIIGIIVSSIIGGGGSNLQPVITVTEEQTELIRVAAAGTQHAVNQKTQNLAYNVQLAMESARNQTLDYLATNHQKVGAKTLALKHSTVTDTALTNALTASTYDSTFTDILQTDLVTYSQQLKTAYNANPGPKGKTLLSKQYDAAQLLITQTKQ